MSDLMELPYSLALKTSVSRFVKVVSAETGEAAEDWNKNDTTRLSEVYLVETTSTRREDNNRLRLTGVTYRVGNDYSLMHFLEVFVTDPYGNRALVERQKGHREFALEYLMEVHQRWTHTINDGLSLDA